MVEQNSDIQLYSAYFNDSDLHEKLQELNAQGVDASVKLSLIDQRMATLRGKFTDWLEEKAILDQAMLVATNSFTSRVDVLCSEETSQLIATHPEIARVQRREEKVEVIDVGSNHG